MKIDIATGSAGVQRKRDGQGPLRREKGEGGVISKDKDSRKKKIWPESD